MTRRMAEIISKHTSQDVEQVMKDIDRDRFMTPGEAVQYGLVDAIMEEREPLARVHPGLERGGFAAGGAGGAEGGAA
jgi:ATP-dependent protease ClpP protease subunit